MFPPPLRCIRRFFCPMGREFLFCFVGRGLPDAPLQWFSAGSFAACGRRESSALRCGLLSHCWESNQRIAGDAADGLRLRCALPRSIGPLSPDPRYGGYPLKWTEHFRRAKSERRSAISPGLLGPGFAKIRAWCGSKTAPGFSQPTLPVRFHRRGGLWPPAGAHSAPLHRNCKGRHTGLPKT